MKNFELRSSFPCLVKWSGGEEFLEDGIILEFDRPTRLFVYPATGRREDTSFVLDMLKPNDRVRTFNFEDKQIFYLVWRFEDEIFVDENISVGGKDVKFKIGTTRVEIACDGTTRSVEIIPPKKYELLSVEEFAILKISSLSGMAAIVYNTKGGQIEKIEGNKIDVVGSDILNLKDGFEEKYTLLDGSVTKIRSLDFQPRNNDVVGMAFLQAVKDKKLELACNFLHASLLPSPEKLKAYFGEILDFFPLDEKKYVLIKKSGHDVVQLDLNENLITNIDILN